MPECHADIPEDVRKEMLELDTLVPGVYDDDPPYLPGCGLPLGPSSAVALANCWGPCIAVTGASGIPDCSNAGNVLRKGTQLTMCVRLPPTVDAGVAFSACRAVLERDPPHNAKVQFVRKLCASGWAAPAMEPWLKDALKEASQSHFGKPPGVMGLGVCVPLPLPVPMHTAKAANAKPVPTCSYNAS